MTSMLNLSNYINQNCLQVHVMLRKKGARVFNAFIKIET